MRKSILLVVCALALCGCAAGQVVPDRVRELEQALGQKDVRIEEQRLSIETKNSDIASLQGLLAQRDKQLADRDELINQLRKRLEGFGVFD